jgi:hypothetical protein
MGPEAAMAYMRGKYYLWASGDVRDDPDNRRLHIWSADGEDSWDVSGWACDEDGIRHPGMEHASGTQLPMHVMDEFVIQRLAQMIEEGVVDAAIDRALERRGSYWQKRGEKLRSVLRDVSFEEPDPL